MSKMVNVSAGVSVNPYAANIGDFSFLDDNLAMINRPWRVCATRGNFYYTTDGSGGQTRFESWIRAAICRGGVTALRLVFCNKYSADESESSNSLSAYTLESSIVVNGVLIPITFDGRKNPIIDPDTSFIISDPIGIDLSEGQIIEVRTGAIIISGGRLPVGLRSGGNATVKVRSSSATSQIYTTTAMTTPSGGAAVSVGLVPVAVLGKVKENVASVLMFGDSQVVGTGDVSEFSTGLFGGVERALGYSMIGFSNGARGGDKTGSYSSASCSARLSLLPYITHVYANMGINDVIAGRTASNILSNVDVLINKCEGAGVKLVYESIFTVTTSNNSWANQSGQTVTTGFSVGGVRDQVNVGLLARANQGKLIYLDTASVLIDPLTNKWLSNCTDDGTHTSANGHLLRRDYIAERAIHWHHLL